MILLFSFARNPFNDPLLPISYEVSEEIYQLREDVQSALDVIDICRKCNFKIEESEPRRNLTAAKLRGANLAGANLSCVDLPKADLRYAYLTNAILSDAFFYDADLTGARLTGVIGMTQTQLHEAYFAPGCPPECPPKF